LAVSNSLSLVWGRVAEGASRKRQKICLDIYYSIRNYNLTLSISAEVDRGKQDSHQAHTF